MLHKVASDKSGSAGDNHFHFPFSPYYICLLYTSAAVFFYKGRHQGLTAFNHDNEGISAFFHVAYVVFAEVTAVEDEAYFFIAILLSLIHILT